MLGLLALFGDTVYFLIIASYGDRSPDVDWRRCSSCSCWPKRSAFYSAVEVVVITGVAAIFCAVLPYESLRAPGIDGGGGGRLWHAELR